MSDIHSTCIEGAEAFCVHALGISMNNVSQDVAHDTTSSKQERGKQA